MRGFWFSWTFCPSVIFYIHENKALAGREERGEGEAVGRNVVLTFFEPLPGHPGLVQRVDRSGDGMKPQQMTVAELLTTCGRYLEHDPQRSSADTEALLEETFAVLDLRRFSGSLETRAEELHVYSLTDEENAEEAFVRETPLESLTKVALARFLERSGGEPRRQGWERRLGDLKEQARQFLDAPGALAAPRPKAKAKAAPPAPQAKPKAKGAGKARGKGKAKAKAGH